MHRSLPVLLQVVLALLCLTTATTAGIAAAAALTALLLGQALVRARLHPAPELPAEATATR